MMKHKINPNSKWPRSTKYNQVLNETFNIYVNGEAYSIKIVEDSQGPLRIVLSENLMNARHNRNSSSESDDDVSA